MEEEQGTLNKRTCQRQLWKVCSLALLIRSAGCYAGDDVDEEHEFVIPDVTGEERLTVRCPKQWSRQWGM